MSTPLHGFGLEIKIDVDLTGDLTQSYSIGTTPPMRRARPSCRILVMLPAFAAASFGSAVSSAAPDNVGLPSIGPRQGSGQRHVSGDSPPAASGDAQSDVASSGGEKSKPGQSKTHRVGKPPSKPKSRLPDGAPASQPNQKVRRIIANGATDEELRAGKNDPELRALREAERVLFPEPLRGANAGWSWDLPRPAESDGAEVVDSGLPPSGRLHPKEGKDESLSKADRAWLDQLVMPNLPVRLDARVTKYLKFYRDSSRGQAIARAWAKKSGRYAPALKAELARAGLPTDLVWLSLIESGHNPTIRSPAGAAGLWQFVPATVRLYGLTIDRWVDERLDPLQATEAAIRLLSDLHRRFGSWELAMAAYNMGHGGMSRAIRKYNTNDFWQLSRYEAGIPWETTLYVPKVFAIAIVMNNKQAFGIADVTPDPPVTFDTVRVDPGVSLKQVARAAGTTLSKLEALNGQYLKERTPPADHDDDKRRGWPVRVPEGTGASVDRKLTESGSSRSERQPYVARLGDTVEAIAGAYGVSEGKLRAINDIGRGEVLRAGTVLLLPSGARSKGKAGTADEDEVTVVPPRQFSYPDRERVFYRVVSGDNLSRIARAFRVTRSELVTWNSLDGEAQLQSGMTLQVYVDPSTDLSRVRHLAEQQTRVLVAGTPQFFDYYEGLKGKQRLVIRAREGDTLRSIGRRYGMSVGWMERVNRQSRHDELESGESVVVYAKRGVAAKEREADDPQPLEAARPPRPDALPAGRVNAPRAAQPDSEESPGG